MMASRLKDLWVASTVVCFVVRIWAVTESVVLAQFVIHISADGLGALQLEQLLVGTPECYPNLRRLVREGASTFNARSDYHYTDTLPNHFCMITGRPVLQPPGQPETLHHGYIYNYMEPGWTIHTMGNTQIGYIASVFDVVHDHGLKTAFFASKGKLAICYQSYNAENGAPDTVGDDNGRNKIDYALVTDYDSTTLMRALLELLADTAPNYTFLHLSEPDLYGHGYGWSSPTWNAAVGVIDNYLGLILAAIDTNVALSHATTVILTADHGGTPLYTHGNPEDPLNHTVPVLIWGPGWPAGADLYDLFRNRFDPGQTRPHYSMAQQPLRNGDTGNLALLALGLPPIPGSTRIPILGQPQVTLTCTPTVEGVWLMWPSPSTDFVLETSASLGPNAIWEQVTSGINDDGTNKSLLLIHTESPLQRFYRLRKN